MFRTYLPRALFCVTVPCLNSAFTEKLQVEKYFKCTLEIIAEIIIRSKQIKVSSGFDTQ